MPPGLNQMLNNRSVPSNIVLPHLFYDNVDHAAAWLTKAFGFEEHYRYGDPPQGVQMHLGEAWIMLGSTRPGRITPASAGARTSALTVFVEDVDAHFEAAKTAGAKILEELNETIYGERQYVAEDLAGHQWLFSRHAKDVAPQEWGAVVATA
jgi:uncharacterized glyoxalase superfamily protein PhnB